MNINSGESVKFADNRIHLRTEAIMSFSKSFKYGVLSNKRPVAIFYTVVIVLYLTFIVISLFAPGGAISGMDMSSLIFLFVFGITSFKENFYMLLQNGVSRKNMFLGTVLSLLVISFFVAAVDTVLAQLLGLVPAEKFTIASLFQQLYGSTQYIDSSAFAVCIHEIAWCGMIKFAFASIGLFIGCAYYKMNALTKTLVSCGVPCFFLLGLPLIDLALTDIDIYGKLKEFLLFFFGFSDGVSSYQCVLCCLALSIVVSGITFLLLRKTSVK